MSHNHNTVKSPGPNFNTFTAKMKGFCAITSILILIVSHLVTSSAFVKANTCFRFNDVKRTQPRDISSSTRAKLFVHAPIPDTFVSISSTSSFFLAKTEAWVKPLAFAIGPILNFMTFAMLCRVVLSWYPEMDIRQAPWIFVVVPTDPLLRATRNLIPPAFGVDMSPIAWLGVFTFIHEILLGQQGLLTLKIHYGI